MGDPDRISRADWETLLHAPLRVYSLVAAAEGKEPGVAQFRALTESLQAATGHFEGGTIGHVLVATLVHDLDPVWAAYTATDRSARDGLRAVPRALREAPEDEGVAIRDWLLDLAVDVAEARRTLGEGALSGPESKAIGEIADWLDRPGPAAPAP